MPGIALVRALEDDWRETLDAVARRRGWATSHEVARLAARVAALSLAYNDVRCARAGIREAGEARLGFWFARDVPKGAAAVREFVAKGALPASIRVLDVGAGLGAMTWGLVRALSAAGSRGGLVDATWLDEDGEALELGASIARARARGRAGDVELRVQTVAQSADAPGAIGSFDVILVGQVLSELTPGASEQARVDQHADLLRALAERVNDGGFLVVIEPALRDRTRHLHRVRDALAPTIPIYAPCLHQAMCPALDRDTDWCHEDVRVDLPSWLIPVARAAGLRHQGLTFSYLVLRPGGGTLSEEIAVGARGGRLRVVSDAIRTKGKHETFLCGDFAKAPEGAIVATRKRGVRLDRDRAPGNDAWSRLERGDVVVVDPALDVERPRLGAKSLVRRVE
jgi:2-polyprenyl-3-methyl-5-hydroxy-6-metoxy-1,4-benzoquinol methylase